MNPVQPMPRPAAGHRHARGRPLTAPHLVLVHGEDRVAADAGTSVTIGREDVADLVVGHPLVSRVHAELRALPTGWELVDRSQNGVFVGGERLQKLRLSPGATPASRSPWGWAGPRCT